MFGIEDVEYKPKCQPAASAGCSQACSRAPWDYTTKAKDEVGRLMSNSSMDRWLEMSDSSPTPPPLAAVSFWAGWLSAMRGRDTYYFSTSRYLDALDWYSRAVTSDSLGVAVMNRKDISDEGYLARFHALDRSGADWLNIFMLPASDAWLPWLKRWKSRCAGCEGNGRLSCWELKAAC